MTNEMICQSCTMPITDTADRGTEKDGSASTDYCKYCFQNGEFTDPGLTLEKMRCAIISQVQQGNMPSAALQNALSVLPALKRWKQNQP